MPYIVHSLTYTGQVKVVGDWMWQDIKTTTVLPPFLMADKFIAEREAFAFARAWTRRRLREGVMSEFRIQRKEIINTGTWVSEHYVEPRENNPVASGVASVAQRRLANE